jgi:hypothetical protein
MAKYKVGTRVYAVSHADLEKKEVYSFGEGVYEGDAVPDGTPENPAPGGWMGKMIVEKKTPNPKIKLDNGKIVWGCECWWGPEAMIKEETLRAGLTIIPVDIDEERAKIAAEDVEDNEEEDE